MNKGVVILLLIAYILSPIDLIPELALGPFGLVDDAGALLALVGTALSRGKPH